VEVGAAEVEVAPSEKKKLMKKARRQTIEIVLNTQ